MRDLDAWPGVIGALLLSETLGNICLRHFDHKRDTVAYKA